MNMSTLLLLVALFVFVIPIAFLAVDKKKTPPKASPQKAEPVKSQWQLEREERERQAAEWKLKHGRIVTALAGVTFDNDDGTSRQRLLKDYLATQAGGEVTLQECDYKGSPAVRVLLDGECVGNIPRGNVREVLDVLDRLENASLNVEVFYPEADDDDDDDRPRRKGEKIYRADLILVYAK